MKPASDQEENELVILQLRQLCEGKQKVHLHIGEVPQVRPTWRGRAPPPCVPLVVSLFRKGRIALLKGFKRPRGGWREEGWV